MTLKTNLEEKLKDAMRNNLVTERNTIRMVLTSIKLAEVERGKALEDNEIIAILQKEIKMRKETILEAEKGAREDIIKATQDEIVVLENYLPKQMSQEEVRATIAKIIADVNAVDIKEMGKVMKVAVPEIAGKASNDLISQTVRAMLTEKK
jgi:uncharacterized protein YqeY